VPRSRVALGRLMISKKLMLNLTGVSGRWASGWG
jgi:hypothetical protein